jgi:cyclic pyranopterin phosphate synthase
MTRGRSAQVGFITAMSCPFCARCNRIRIAADGTLYPCLMDRPAGSVLAVLRPVFDGAALDRVLEAAVKNKAPEHSDMAVAVMTEIGG